MPTVRPTSSDPRPIADAPPRSRRQRARQRAGSQPSFPYVRLPERLMRASLDEPHRVGVYALISRVWLVERTPVPLSAADLTRFDLDLSRGAAQRAIAWLTERGWLAATRGSGTKNHLTPTWGIISGTARPWQADDPRLGRPPHVRSVTLDTRLLDVCMGRLVAFDGQRAAHVTRYLGRPALTLADVGAYALLLAGLGGDGTEALREHGLVHAGKACPLGEQRALLARLSQRALTDSDAALTPAGLRRAGLAVDPVPTAGAPIVFAPRESIGSVIGDLIGNVIGNVIGSEGVILDGVMASTCGEQPESPIDSASPGIPWMSIESEDHDRPTRRARRGGRDTRPGLDELGVLPNTEAARLLHELGAGVTAIRQLAGVPPDVVREAIRYATANPRIRSRVGLVVWALNEYQSCGILPWDNGPRAPTDWGVIAADWVGSTTAPDNLGDPVAEPNDDVDVSPGDAATPRPQAAVTQGTTDDIRGDVTERLRAALEMQLSARNLIALAGLMDGMSAHYDAHGLRVALAVTHPPAERIDALQDACERVLRGWGVAPVATIATAPPAPSLPPSESPPPTWADPAIWATLPLTVRAALRAATIVSGQIEWSSPAVARMMVRYADDIRAVVRVPAD